MAEQNSFPYRPAQSKIRPHNVPIYELPVLYIKALFNSSPNFFAQQGERGTWGLVWFQILLLIVVPAVLGLARDLDRTLAGRTTTHSRFLYDVLISFSIGTSTAGLILRTLAVPLFFFITISLQFLLARIFGGVGRYLEQSFSTLLYQVPLAILSALINLVVVFVHSIDLRTFTPLVSFLLFIYGIVLNITMLKGTHRLTGGKAVSVVILYYVVLFLVAVGLLILLASFIISTLRRIGS